MVKGKRAKKASSERVYAKKVSTEKVNPFAEAKPFGGARKLNPFEVHVNKEKFQILGRVCKHDKGLPGVSRAKATKRRMKTLGREFTELHKSNKFVDRRIGKYVDNAQLSDEVMNARLVAERLSQLKQSKASKFNLNDDVILTHRGQTLEEIEQFRDDRSDDEADNEQLDAEFTEAAHFGGDRDTAIKDRKSAIDEMIMEQKKRKLELIKEKDEVHNLTEKLDSNYKQLSDVFDKMPKNDAKFKPAPDDYDRAMREMIFEPRGQVTDKLLSEEQAAKKERERLEQLERERLRRMQTEVESGSKTEQPKHRSADDLDDGYFVQDEEEESTLAYNLDGELNSKQQDSEEEESESDDEDSKADDDVEDDDEKEEEEVEEEEEEDEIDDNLSDLKSNSSDSEEDEEDEVCESKSKKQDSPKINEQKGETTIAELPYTIELPASFEKFAELLSAHTADNQATIVERIIKYNHPKLDGVNQLNVVKLFTFLLRYINDLFADTNVDNIAEKFRLLDRLNPHMYDLMHLSPQRMSASLLDQIKQNHEEYKKNPKIFPPLKSIILFKLVSNYCSTSDFRHPVVTPCFIFIEHILSEARVRSRQDVALGLFLVTTILEYAHQSRRFLPAALNFLLGIIFLSIPKRSVGTLKIVPPFSSTGTLSTLLVLGDDELNVNEQAAQCLKSEDLVLTNMCSDFKVRALNTTLRLVEDFVSNVRESVGANYLAQPFLDMVDRLSLDMYPEYVGISCASLRRLLEEVTNKKLNLLVPPAKKPKALRLLEPRIETVYDDKRRPKLSKEKEERVKLLAKVKRETKGAIREIRRDTDFVQKMRLMKQIQSDKERRDKVKQIYQEASQQQGELNELARAKKRKKF